MSTFQNIYIHKYIDNWMGYTGTPPSDPPNTIGGLGSVTSQTLSFSDSDRVEIVHRTTSLVYPYIYDWPAEKIPRIQFVTPNDGISHSYNTDVVCNLLGPSGSPFFDMTSSLEYYNGSLWMDFSGTGYNSTSSAGSVSGPNFDAYYGYGHFYLNGAVLLPNVTYRLSCQCDNSIYGAHLGAYFDYSVVMSVYCADFAGVSTKPNTIQMIIEQN